jgi:hypothetical protein
LLRPAFAKLIKQQQQQQQQGGWLLDAISKAFSYITGTSKNDAKVGRAISSWGEVERGGQAPCLDFMNDETKKAELIVQLFPSIVSKVPKELLYSCAASLLMYIDEIRKPDMIAAGNAVFSRIRNACRNVGINVNEMKESCRRSFISRNASYFPQDSPFFSEIQNGDIQLLPGRSLIDTITRMTQVVQRSVEETARMQRENAIMLQENVAIRAELNRLTGKIGYLIDIVHEQSGSYFAFA